MHAARTPQKLQRCKCLSLSDFPHQLYDVLLDGLDVGLDFWQRPGRLILVEVAVKADLIADFADFVILVVAQLRAVFLPPC